MGLIDSLEKVDAIDASRIYIGGLSQGGMGVLDLIAATRSGLRLPLPFVVQASPKRPTSSPTKFPSGFFTVRTTM